MCIKRFSRCSRLTVYEQFNQCDKSTSTQNGIGIYSSCITAGATALNLRRSRFVNNSAFYDTSIGNIQFGLGGVMQASFSSPSAINELIAIDNTVLFDAQRTTAQMYSYTFHSFFYLSCDVNLPSAVPVLSINGTNISNNVIRVLSSPANEIPVVLQINGVGLGINSFSSINGVNTPKL